MAEATQRLRQDKLRATMTFAARTLALQAALKATKHQLRAQGLRVAQFTPPHLGAQAEAYLALHRQELIAEASQIVER
jgi:hypothetical protein